MPNARDKPRFTIGMPVYNGAATVGEAITSLLAQTEQDFELLIADNASTDHTLDAAREAARGDPRVRVIPSETNLGAPPNFHRVLQEAAAPLFMWASHDDRWLPDYIKANAEPLDADDSLIASVARVRILGGDNSASQRLTNDTFPLKSSPQENVLAYLRHPGANSRLYSLFRTEVLRRSITPDIFWGFDWWWIVRTLAHGGYHEVNEPLMERRDGGESRASKPAAIDRYNRSIVGRLLPKLELTRRLIAEPHVPRNLRFALWHTRENTKEAAVVAVDRFAETVPIIGPPIGRARRALRKPW